MHPHTPIPGFPLLSGRTTHVRHCERGNPRSIVLSISRGLRFAPVRSTEWTKDSDTRSFFFVFANLEGRKLFLFCASHCGAPLKDLLCAITFCSIKLRENFDRSPETAVPLITHRCFSYKTVLCKRSRPNENDNEF